MISWKRVWSRLSSDTLTRRSPASTSGPASVRSATPFVVSDRSSRPVDVRQALDQRGHVAAHERLAAGDAHAVDADGAEDARQPLDLLVRQHLGAREPRQALRGHAVLAAEVAAVGDRDPDGLDATAERVDERLAASGQDTGTSPPPSVGRPASAREPQVDVDPDCDTISCYNYS